MLIWLLHKQTKGQIMKNKKLNVKIEFNCDASKDLTEQQLNEIILYHIYEKIGNISDKGVKLTIKD